ncbi:MAG: KH domain-containing protein [Halobacteriales archaeon]|nr:KH domain-containing protein [Halobacteriales archaeon]
MPEHLKIPDDRIGVLIGTEGKTKSRIEDLAEVSIEVDSESGAVSVTRGEDADPVRSLKGPRIVKAIARGFPPESALRLLEDVDGDEKMMIYESIDIDAATGSDSERRAKKGRLIGRNGRTRELMEELTGAEVRIYGKTFGAIGTPQQVDVAMTAAEMLLDGAPHGTVYSYMEDKRNEMKRSGIEYVRKDEAY